MSPKIQGELSLQVNGTWLTRVSFLQRVELDAVVQVAMSLEPQVYVPTELLPSENLYYMCNGTVVHRGEVVLGGSVLGTDCFLQRDDLRSRPARALTHVEVSLIHRDVMMGIIHRHIEAVDQTGRQVVIYAYPRASSALRWEMMRIALTRELRARAGAAAQSKAASRWDDAFHRMEGDVAGMAAQMEARMDVRVEAEMRRTTLKRMATKTGDVVKSGLKRMSTSSRLHVGGQRRVNPECSQPGACACAESATVQAEPPGRVRTDVGL